MPKQEHYSITRLGNLRRVFNAFFSRTQSTKLALPPMNVAVANIVRDAQVIAAGLRHIEEGHFDSQELSNEFAHLTQFAISLPETIAGDAGFWGYALNLVDLRTFREGAEYCEIEQLRDFIGILNQVVAIKQEIRDDVRGTREKGV
jgi:hypothetical protein